MVFFSKNALAEHEAKVPKDQRSWKGDSLVFNCSSCNFKSCSTSGLQIHEKKHTTSKMDLRIHEKMYKSTNMFYDGVPRGLSLKEISIDVDFVKPNYPCDTCNMVSQSIFCFSYYYFYGSVHLAAISLLFHLTDITCWNLNTQRSQVESVLTIIKGLLECFCNSAFHD